MSRFTAGQKRAMWDLSHEFDISIHSIVVAFTIADDASDETLLVEFGKVAANDIAKMRERLNPKD